MTIYQDKDGNRVETRDAEADPVKFWPQGGGPQYRMPRHVFEQEFEPAPEPTFRRATVTAEFLGYDPDVILPCWSNGNRWNGWGMPYLPRKSVDQLVALMPNVRWADNGEDVLVEDEDAEPAPGVPAGWYRITPIAMPDGPTWPVGSGSWTWDACEPVPTLEETVERMKREVKDCIRIGQIPADVQSFVDLHDHIDANELGGFCEDDFSDRLIAHFGGRDEHEGMPDAMLDYINAAQGAINEWLKAGGHKEPK